MRKFTVQSRKGKTSIFEVEVEILKIMDDSSVAWLKPGEYKARILQPTIFHQKIEKMVDNKKEVTLVPDVWCWHAFHDSLEEAKAYSEGLVRHEFDFNLRKYDTAFTEEDITAAIAAIEVVLLTV